MFDAGDYAIATHRPVVVLLDVHLPGGGGVEVMRRHPSPDTLYLARQEQELAKGGSSTTVAVRAALLDVPGILECEVFENTSNVTDGDGLPDVILSTGDGTLLALDGKTYRLDDKVCVIADENGVESIAGIMGGEASGCTEATTDVLIESAL